jgi:hypothetical protein
MQTDDPLEILADIEALRSRTSNALNADGWQWMTVWSLVAFGAGLTALVDALEGIAGFYWMVAVPIALGVTAVLERRSKEQRAVRRDSRPHVRVGAAMLVVNLAASFTLEAEATVIVIWVVIGLGFAAFAHFDGDRPATAIYVVASLLAAGLGTFASDPFAAYAAISMLFAGLLAGSAVQMYSRYRLG